VTILSPTGGEVLADTIRVVVSVASQHPVDRVSILANGDAVQTRWLAPWEFAWDPEVRDTTRLILEARAYDSSGRCGRSGEVAVTVVPNRSPLLRLVYPYPDHYIPFHRVGERAWRCQAWDPEDGPLGDSSVAWYLGDAYLGTGTDLAPPDVAPGTHALRLVATDRWGRRASLRSRITVFVPAEPDDPLATLEAFRLAVRSRDAESLRRVLDPDLRWVACDTGELDCVTFFDGERDRPRVLMAFQRLLGDPALRRIAWEWRPGPVEFFRDDGSSLAKVELHGVNLLLERWDGGALVPLASRANGLRLYLREEGRAWRIREWISLPRQRYPEDPSLESLLFPPAEASPGPFPPEWRPPGTRLVPP
jgi:hypothetical protein